MREPRFISRERMEALTERILSEFGFDPHHKMIRPVPIEEIVEFHFDLHIGWEPIDHLDRDGEVMAAILPTEKRIILNETYRDLFEKKIGTYHFTLAHELGHWVLHAAGAPHLLRSRDGGCGKAVPVPSAATYYCRSPFRKPVEEVQADLFAGCLLMPRPMVERAVGQLTRMGLVQLSQLYRLADCFRVSISALSVRLTQLQLLNIDADGRVSRPGSGGSGKYEQLTLEL